MSPLLTVKKLVAGILLTVTACGTLQAAEENFLYHGLLQDRSSHSEAEALFVEKCGMCHRQAGMGTFLLARRLGKENAMLEQRQNLTPEYIKFVARNGIGNMPRIPPGEVSTQQLETIARYLSVQDKQ